MHTDNVPAIAYHLSPVLAPQQLPLLLRRLVALAPRQLPHQLLLPLAASRSRNPEPRSPPLVLPEPREVFLVAPSLLLSLRLLVVCSVPPQPPLRRPRPCLAPSQQPVGRCLVASSSRPSPLLAACLARPPPNPLRPLRCLVPSSSSPPSRPLRSSAQPLPSLPPAASLAPRPLHPPVACLVNSSSSSSPHRPSLVPSSSLRRRLPSLDSPPPHRLPTPCRPPRAPVLPQVSPRRPSSLTCRTPCRRRSSRWSKSCHRC